jgi:hypothetical protein
VCRLNITGPLKGVICYPHILVNSQTHHSATLSIHVAREGAGPVWRGGSVAGNQ